MNFLSSIADKIPRLFKSIADGNMHAEYQLGSRMLNGRQVKLSLVAEVCDPGDNPLSTHSKPMNHTTSLVADPVTDPVAELITDPISDPPTNAAINSATKETA